MRLCALLWAFALGSGLSAAAEPPPDASRIDRLISQLGSTKFAEREEASKALDAIGAPALPALKTGANSPDLEVKRRSGTLVKKIETRLETERLLAATRVRLNVRDATVPEALQALANASGHTLVLQGPPASYSGRRVTLNAGDTTFWQVLDALCRQGELSEAAPAAGAPVQVANLTEMMLLEALRREPALRILPPEPGAPNGARRGTAATNSSPTELRTFSPAAAKPGGIPVILSAGGSEAATFYAGGVRIRATTAGSRPTGDKNEALVRLDLAAEPTLQALRVRDVRINRADDEKGQPLSSAAQLPPGVGNANQFIVQSGRLAAPARALARDQVSIRLQASGSAPRELSELRGTIAAVVQTAPEALITVDDIQKAVGKTITGPAGGSIKVKDVSTNNAQVRIRVELELPTDTEAVLLAGALNPAMAANLARLNARGLMMAQQPFAGGLRFTVESGNARRGEGLTLYDAKGVPFQTQQASQIRAVNNVVTQEYVVSFRPGKDQGAPARLVYKAPRTSGVEIPFEFRDLKLP